jgi:hypothetical protein
MAGRREGASLADPASWVVEEVRRRDVVIVAHHDHLLYAYLDVFQAVESGDSRHTVSFVVSRRIRSLFDVLHDAFIRRQLDALDPFLAAQYGSSMSAWGESRWLYWYEEGHPQPSGNRVWFVTPEEYERLPDQGGVAVLTIGRVDLSAVDVESTVDTTPWTGHSDQEALVAGVRKFEDVGWRVVLFHNFRRRLQKFARDHGLAAIPLAFDPLDLHEQQEAPQAQIRREIGTAAAAKP